MTALDWSFTAVGFVAYCVAGWMLLVCMAAAKRETEPQVTVSVQFRKTAAETDVDVLQEMCREIAARGPLS